MRHGLVAMAMLGLAACAQTPAAPDPAIYAQAVANPARSARDRERDLRDRPAHLLAMTGMAPGMTVADVFGGGGYYSELAAAVVGAQGQVWLINNPPYARYADKDLKPRLDGQRLPNVQSRIVPNDALGLGSEQVDVVLLMITLHDLYYADPENGWMAIDAEQFLGDLVTALRPGGVLLVTDHAAPQGRGATLAKSVHRIEESFARAQLEAQGLRLEQTWDGLRNAQDDRQTLVFDPAIRGRTDRFVHVYRKPRDWAG